MLKTSFTNRGGLNYTLYSQPVTVSVSENVITGQSPAASHAPETPGANEALPYIMGACALIIIAAAIIVPVTLKRRKNK